MTKLVSAYLLLASCWIPAIGIGIDNTEKAKVYITYTSEPDAPVTENPESELAPRRRCKPQDPNHKIAQHCSAMVDKKCWGCCNPCPGCWKDGKQVACEAQQ